MELISERVVILKVKNLLILYTNIAAYSSISSVAK